MGAGEFRRADAGAPGSDPGVEAGAGAVRNRANATVSTRDDSRGAHCARRRTRGDGSRRGVPHLQRSRAGRAAGCRGAVFELSRIALTRAATLLLFYRRPGGPARSAREEIRQKTQGEEYQPTVNHSKLTDSNDCTDFFSSFDLLLFFRLPSSLCLLPDILVRLFSCRRQTTGTHVKHVTDHRASDLRCKDFRHSGRA